jgi:hypothetical protein
MATAGTLTVAISGIAKETRQAPGNNAASTPSIKIIFSDLDGTLVHFQRHFGEHGAVVDVDGERCNYLCKKTGLRL